MYSLWKMELSILDEIECLKSCFDEKEFTSCISNHSHILKFSLKDYASITFDVSGSYPTTVPLISLSSSKLTKAGKIELEESIRRYAQELIGSLMIMDIVIYLQNALNDHFDSTLKPDVTNSTEEGSYLVVILIDHIRNKSKYLKLLSSWASDLNVCGSLLMCQKWIFMLLQGKKMQVKEFIVRYKTTCIDVDSKGKSCKEKMSKVLYEKMYQEKRFLNFSNKEFEDVSELVSYFIEMNLEELYINILKPLIG